MKFDVSTTSNNYSLSTSKLLEEIGFTFEERTSTYISNPYYRMKEHEVSIEINTLEELLSFEDKYGEIVLSGNTIEIWDDYRE